MFKGGTAEDAKAQADKVTIMWKVWKHTGEKPNKHTNHTGYKTIWGKNTRGKVKYEIEGVFWAGQGQ